jgi:cyclophilin family peptidyl-prolyl cis-trans isomerase
MANKPTDTTVATQADNFANAALTALYSASSSATLADSSTTSPSSASAANPPSVAGSPPTTSDSSASGQQSNSGQTTSQQVINYQTNYQNSMHATVHTSMGDITIEFFDKDAPNTVANFKKLAAANFYDGVKFHRVMAGFMIQGGDPLTKDDSKVAMWGTGGPGYTFADEIRENNHNVVGTISMANSGPNTNGSQFFINVADNSYLDTKHTTFGIVISGMDVVSKIEHTPTDANNRPLTPVVIQSVALEQ